MSHAPLHTREGGHVFNNGVAFPIEQESDDATPDTVGTGLSALIAGALTFIVATVAALAARI